MKEPLLWQQTTRAKARRLHRIFTVAEGRFPEVGPQLAWYLYKRFRRREAVVAATDQELLAVRSVGPVTLARIRAMFPRVGDAPCPSCGGTGRKRSESDD